jgi:hypothetical protein
MRRCGSLQWQSVHTKFHENLTMQTHKDCGRHIYTNAYITITEEPIAVGRKKKHLISYTKSVKAISRVLECAA